MADLPPLLDWANTKLDVRVTPVSIAGSKAARAYLIDLSRFRLRLSDRTPCVELAGPALAGQSAAQTKLLLDDLLLAQKWQQRNVLVLVDGDASDLRLLCRRDERPPITLDTAAQERIMQDGSQALIEEVSRQTHISALSPYEISRPVTGEQFFGRDNEVRTLVSSAGTSFLIVGNRRMGKTSLMREAMRRLRRTAKHDDTIQYFDCSAFQGKLELFADIVRALAPREVDRVYSDKTFSMPSFFQRMHRARKETLVLCLDEIDHLMDCDAKDNWATLNIFRAISTMTHGDEHPLRLLMAGFRVAHDLARNKDAPVFNFAQMLRVQPFDQKVTEQIVVEPMLNLGVTISDRSAIVHRIFRETGGQPNLIQHYCHFIVQQLEQTESRTLNQAVLDAALKNDAIRGRTADELMSNATNLEQLIVFCFIHHAWSKNEERFSLEDADGWLKQHGVQLLRDDLEKAIEGLIMSGVLNRDGRSFSFTFGALPRTLNDSRDPKFQIAKIIEEGL